MGSCDWDLPGFFHLKHLTSTSASMSLRLEFRILSDYALPFWSISTLGLELNLSERGKLVETPAWSAPMVMELSSCEVTWSWLPAGNAWGTSALRWQMGGTPALRFPKCHLRVSEDLHPCLPTIATKRKSVKTKYVQYPDEPTLKWMRWKNKCMHSKNIATYFSHALWQSPESSS